MALYVSIDESYSVTKLNGLDCVVHAADGYTLQDGRTITKKIAQYELKHGDIRLYKYDDFELMDAKASGSVRGIDWALKIQKL